MRAACGTAKVLFLILLSIPQCEPLEIESGQFIVQSSTVISWSLKQIFVLFLFGQVPKYA